MKDSVTFANELGKSSFCIWPGFLHSEALLEVQNDLKQIETGLGFYRAGTGKGKQKEVRDLVRRDEVHWLDREAPSSAQKMLWQRIDMLKQAFNRTLYLGLSDFEGHYSIYPPGGFFKRHLDCFKNDDARTVSLVLYLNRAWKPKDGGRLRIYHSDSHTDIDPIGGTLACFLSREKEHEVLTSRAERISVSGWFKVAV